MAMTDGLRVKGILDIYDQDGRLLQHVENLITNVGLQQLAKLLAGTDTKKPSHIAVGTGTNAPAVTDTTLQAEHTRIVTDTPSVYASYYARWVCTFTTSQANADLREAGLFDAAVGGNLWSRVNINVNKTSAMSLTFDWKWQIARG